MFVCLFGVCAQKKSVCVEELQRALTQNVVTQKRHERALSHARACVSEHLLFMHCVCGLCFYLCFVCVPPFSEEGGDVVHECGGFTDVCRDILNLCVVVVVECVRAC